MNIPSVDLAANYQSIAGEIDKAVNRVLKSGSYIRGTEVSEFEKSFAAKLGVKHCIAVGNGTDALFVILKALGIKENDEVLTPALSWISSAETISQTGATPVFVDIDEDFFTIDLSHAKRCLSTKTKAIVAVHLYGQPAPLDQLRNFCVEHNLLLIEDCAQSHFSAVNNVYTGTVGNAAAFSFYPTKNLGAYGDAGCIVTNSDELTLYARRFSNHGGLHKNEHLFEGINSRMDELQAAILSAKLPFIDQWNAQRKNAAKLYSQQLVTNHHVCVPKVRESVSHVFHQYVIKAEKRDQLKDFLLKKGVKTDIHFDPSLPFEQAYVWRNYTDTDFPIASKISKQILSLPMYPELSEASIKYICDAIQEFYLKEI